MSLLTPDHAREHAPETSPRVIFTIVVTKNRLRDRCTLVA